MLISIKDSGLVTNLLERQLLRPESIYLASGDRLSAEAKNIYEACLVRKDDLNKGTEVYIESSIVFNELDSCYKILKRVLTSEDLNDDFEGIVKQVAKRIRSIAYNWFDLAYAYLSWHTIEDYPVMHHLMVAVTLARVGDRCGEFTEKELESCLCAALTMNISMLTLQSELRLQVEPLSREQRESIRKHPEQSANKLRLLGVSDEQWLSIVENHHELPDGRGYPRQVRLTDKPTMLLNICDSFNARIAQREYRHNFTAEGAIKELFSKSRAEMSNLIAVMLEELGIYPSGSLLQLQNNQIGCSLVRGQSATCPMVLVFRNTGSSSDRTMLVDTSKREFTVKKALPRRELPALPDLLEIISRIA